MSEERKCILCKIIIEKSSNVTILSCGHVFHARCAHGPLTRNYAYCPVCKPPESEELISTKDDTAHNPLDFGDDIHVDTLLSRRLILLKRYDESGEVSSSGRDSIAKVRDYLAQREKDVCTEKHGDTVEDLSADDKSNWFRTIWDMGTMALESGVDRGTNDTSGADDVYEYMENEIDAVISRRTSVQTLVTKHGVDAHVLIKKEYTIAVLFGLGYTLDDMILLNATWMDIRALGLNHLVWKAYKDKLPVVKLTKIWKIKIFDVYNDVCSSGFDNLVSIGFTLEEMITLGASTIDILIELGLVRTHFKDVGFSMADWKKLGMTGVHVTKLGMDEHFLKERLQWINTEDKIIIFKDAFGIDPATLAVKKVEAPPRRARPKT